MNQVRNACLLVVFALALPQWVVAAEKTGQLQWAQRSDLGMSVSGVVTRINVEPGARVAKGSVLVALDDRRYQAELTRARAEVSRLKAKRDEAERELARTRELYDRNLMSDHELELAKIAKGDADAGYAAAGAALTQAKLDLEYSAIRAPYDAIVVEVKASVGQAVAAQLTPITLVSIAEAGRMAVGLPVDVDTMRQLKEGQAVSVEVNKRRFEARVGRIGLEPSAQSPLTYPVEVLFDLPEGVVLRPGESAKVMFP